MLHGVRIDFINMSMHVAWNSHGIRFLFSMYFAWNSVLFSMCFDARITNTYTYTSACTNYGYLCSNMRNYV